jgi:acetyl-CoA decarbonylase/synthase complex subunit alpha
MLLGRFDKPENWMVYDARTGKEVEVSPGPEHLFYAVENMEECMVLTAKLAIRPNDTSKGRAIKLSHYIDLHEKYKGYFPDDVYRFIRRETDVPITLKDKIHAQMKENKWKERAIPDPTLLKRMVYGGNGGGD